MLDFSQGLEPPYLTSELEGIGGRLRATVDDFIVEEIPLYEPVDEGQHLYVRLTKAGLTTKDVELQLARLFQLRKGAVGFAGMKDKHATTTQTFSLNVGYQRPEFAAEAVARIEAALPVQVAWARFHQNKLRAGHLLGNRFRITIRDIALSPAETLARATAIVDQIRATGLPNYFGPQRFGYEGGNLTQGLAVLRGERFIRDKWRRRFMVSAYQSFLCNCYLGARVERQAFLNLLDGDVAKKYATGGMFDVEDLAAEQLRYAAHEISFTAPMYGAKMRQAQQAAGALEAEIFAQSGITLEQLAKARMEGTRRLGRILVPDVTVQVGATEETDASVSFLQVDFSLPKGSFATVVLRELMKVDLFEVPADDE
jgi:tRNA pseudouridine13 synthase